ncbi:MAG: hypothetical protein CVT49_13000 [candidate division Zixibacteria bacterium HGW-Zixibacteria-1]|nr:MAG: hypothetical protein CVT49_13000 [candidate division Zixibacteria bacterium HGW-Zixibacteria-1]
MAWNHGLGLKDGFFYGGKLGIDFGPLIGLEASYLTSGKLWTTFSEIDLIDTAGSTIPDHRVTVRRFGGDLLIRWPSMRIAPFVRVGGGVIRFEPETGPNSEKIDVRFGGGFDYILSNRVRTRAWIEMNRFRLDRYSLAPGGATSGLYPLDPDADKIRNNLSVGLSLDYALGQSRFRAVRTGERLHPFSALELEPLLGRLDFGDSRLNTVTVAGARIGGELNPYVGWGLFYWHAMESDLSDTRPLQSYGGEARFNLASKSGPQPYVTIGAGQFDFLSNYFDNEGNKRDDRTALILGAGIRAEIINGIQLDAGVRDYMYGEGRLDRVSGTDEIRHNWLLSGALVFGIGGRGSDTKQRPTIPQTLPNSIISTSLMQDTTATTMKQLVFDDTRTVVDRPPAQRTPTGYVSDKNIVIPVPLEGEVYIRYGTPSSDVWKKTVEGEFEIETAKIDSISGGAEQERRSKADTIVSETAKPAAIVPAEIFLQAPAGEDAPVSRRELDSLLNKLTSDIGAMLAGQMAPQAIQKPATETTGVAAAEDSLLTALRDELAKTQQERQRLDSLLREKTLTVSPEPDSVNALKIQQAIADQVAAALAAKSEGAGKEITQTDLQNMMTTLAIHMDSVSSHRAKIDSARLQDQLRLEVIRQTKSQDDFQRALEDFMRRYGQSQDNKTILPPSIIVTQPAPSSQIIPREEPSTVVIKPDTQYVVIRDSTGKAGTVLPISDFDATTPPAEKDFIDLRPSGYTGFSLEKPKQFILGSRLDIGPITAKEERLRLVPEFALGLGGGGVSVMAVMNVEYAIANIESGDYRIVPYARMGFGVLGFGGDISERDTEGVLNFTYGISIDPRKAGLFRGIGNPAVFIEHQIIDLFDLNRVVLGFQWSR